MAGILFVIILQRMDVLSSAGNFFKPKPVLIDDTPLLVREIRELTELITITSFDEVVVDSTKPSTDIINSITGLPINPFVPPVDKIVIVAKGSVQAGTDLRRLMESDILVEEDSVAVILPQAEILEVIVNPSGFTTFSESGVWSPDAVNLVKAKAKRAMEVRAFQKNVLSLANQRSKMLMENFLRAVGFRKVSVLIR
jgi:hypothetical protein